MAQTMTRNPETHGAARSEAERLLSQWPHLDAQLFPEGSDCYGDPARAEYVADSYSPIVDMVSDARPGDPILLIGRNPETPQQGGFKRVFALGELAGGGAGVLLDFRAGQIVFPTESYALLVRRSLTALSGYQGPTLHEGALESGVVFGPQAMLPPKDDLMDRPVYTNIGSKGQTNRNLRSIEREEIWNTVGEIAIGRDDVAALMERSIKTNSKRTRRLYRNDFLALVAELGGQSAELITE